MRLTYHLFRIVDVRDNAEGDVFSLFSSSHDLSYLLSPGYCL